MKTLKMATINLQNKLMMGASGIFTKREKGDHLLEVLGVIVIAVVLLIFFKDEIIALFQKMISSTSSSVDSLFENVTNAPVSTPQP